jgi:murein DD-endopeptidase MepM/ murein hydrolase activator NlpD
VYAHLDSIAPGIVPGVRVEEGTLIGAVGVSGTSAESRPGTESPHLHFEIWLGDRWLGQGISIRETTWWLSRVFAGS